MKSVNGDKSIEISTEKDIVVKSNDIERVVIGRVGRTCRNRHIPRTIDRHEQTFHRSAAYRETRYRLNSGAPCRVIIAEGAGPACSDIRTFAHTPQRKTAQKPLGAYVDMVYQM